MRKASFPTKRMTPCHTCVKMSVHPDQSEKPTLSEKPVVIPPIVQGLTVPRKRPSTLQRIPKMPKLQNDVFDDQEGRGKLTLISPVMAAVNQAKALISRRKRCKRRRGCKQNGGKRGKSTRRKVYNPKRVTKKSKKSQRVTKKSKKSH